MKKRIYLIFIFCPLIALSAGAYEPNMYGLSYPVQRGLFDFPQDEGKHAPQGLLGGVEWWYFAAYLFDYDGNLYGINARFWNLMFPWLDLEGNAWGIDMPEMIAFGITDVKNQKFYSFNSGPTVDDEIITADSLNLKFGSNTWLTTGSFEYVLHLEDSDNDVSGDLLLIAQKYPIPSGWDGFVRYKNGEDMYNYGLTRVYVRGILKIKSETIDVRGNGWIDRAWYGTNIFKTIGVLGGKTNAEWFAISLCDATEIFIWRILYESQNPPYIPAVNVVFENGDFEFYEQTTYPSQPPAINQLGYWTSQITNNKYSLGWEIALPRQELELKLHPVVPSQEITGNYLSSDISRYSGLCRVYGNKKGKPIIGFAFVDSTTRHPQALAPNPPSNLKATPAESSVLLKWDRNPEPEVIQYRVKWGTSPQALVNSMTTAQTAYRISALTNGFPYYFAVSAIDYQDRESFPSSVIEAIPGSGCKAKLFTNACCYTWGDRFRLILELSNQRDSTELVDLYIALELDGKFYFLDFKNGYPVFIPSLSFITFDFPANFNWKGTLMEFDLASSLPNLALKWHILIAKHNETIPLSYYVSETYLH